MDSDILGLIDGSTDESAGNEGGKTSVSRTAVSQVSEAIGSKPACFASSFFRPKGMPSFLILCRKVPGFMPSSSAALPVPLTLPLVFSRARLICLCFRLPQG